MPKKAKYIFNSRGGYWGDVTGEHRSYEPGEEIVAPDGEFEGENSDFYEKRPLEPEGESLPGRDVPEEEAPSEEQSSEKEPEEEKPDDGWHNYGGPYYEVRIGGETVEDGIRGKENAQQRYQELTSEE